MWQVHKSICVNLSIIQSTFKHMKLKGSLSAPNQQGNVRYRGPGMLTTMDNEVADQHQVWLVYQPFIRGEERGDDFGPGVMEVALQEAQMPAIDDAMVVLNVQEGDLIVTPDGVTYNALNPVISPDLSFWTFLLEQKR